MTLRRSLIVTLIIAISALIPLSMALAKELVKVIIKGPGLVGEVEVTDSETLTLFRELRFDGMIDGPPPEVSDIRYVIRMGVGDEKKIIATDVYFYYPAPETDTGYMYYADVWGGWSSAEGKWFLVSEESNRALRDFLVSQGAPPMPLLCPVTEPNRLTPPGEHPNSLQHGNADGAIWTELWPESKVIFSPNGPGEIHPDGSLSMKWPWWVKAVEPLIVEGRRLDETAPPLRAEFGPGFVPGFFEASTLTFPTEGCWEVTARAGDHSLTFVTLVMRVGE